jgi:transcriptional regulator with XRE-family HTH domain
MRTKEKELDYKFNVIVGEYLKKIRELQDLSLEHVAVRVRTTRQNIYKYETGQSRLKVDMYKSICYALNIDPATTFDTILDITKQRGL